MSIVQAKCTNCGGNLTVDDSLEAAVCPYCNTPYIVEKAINNYNITNNINVGAGAVVNVYNEDAGEKELIEKLRKLGRQAIASNDYTSAAKYYSQILEKAPDDWEAMLYSIYDNDDSLKETNEIILIAIDLAVASTEDVDEPRKNLEIVVNESVTIHKVFMEFYNKNAKDGIETTRENIRSVLASLSLVGYKIQEIGERGELGKKEDYNKLVASAFRWRTEYALKAKAAFNEDTRNQYADELAAVDPNFEKPTIEKSPGCYVATAVYGSYDCPQVWTLRRYRDNQLAKTWYGRAFIHTYYAISPTIVKWFRNTNWFKNMWRRNLHRMVIRLQNEGVESTPYEDKEW